jgi:hypothetical protein
MRRHLLLRLLATIMVAGTVFQPLFAAAPPKEERTIFNNVPIERIQLLTRGKNWFWFKDYDTPGDEQVRKTFQEHKKKGYRHFRMVYNYANAKSGSFYDNHTARVCRIAAEEKFGLIIDPCHYWFGGGKVLPNFTSSVYGDLKGWWRWFAAQFKDTDPDYIFMQPFNEPAPKDPGDWVNMQEQLCEIIREELPDHTIIGASSIQVFGDWNATRALVEYDHSYENVDNVVYGWHHYYPMEFTHQGADWISELSGVRNSWPGKWGKDWLWEYHVSKVVEFAQRERVYCITDEWGCYEHHSDPADRRQYVYDMIDLLDDNHIGWTYWFDDYDNVEGGFDLDGALAIDSIAVAWEQSGVKRNSVTGKTNRTSIYSPLSKCAVRLYTLQGALLRNVNVLAAGGNDISHSLYIVNDTRNRAWKLPVIHHHRYYRYGAANKR